MGTFNMDTFNSYINRAGFIKKTCRSSISAAPCIVTPMTDKDQIRHLIESNFGRVVTIAKAVRRRSGYNDPKTFTDDIMIGNIALMRAAELFVEYNNIDIKNRSVDLEFVPVAELYIIQSLLRTHQKQKALKK
jgi:DNA-directed RNA polymerase sigma subunit (sigma70/sigma32)